MNGLYLHIPFCERKCFYCSFVVSIGAEHRMDEYVDALVFESKKYSPMKFNTMYWGGGTPSLLEENQIDKLVKHLKKDFSFQHDLEWTVEVNPEGVDLKKAKLLRSLGVNRISLGVQSLNDRYLKYLGRIHNRDKALQTFELLREAGFTNINVDLMFSFPQQSEDEIKKDIAAIAELKSEHVSVYSLTIEENSRFFAQKMKLDDDGKQAREYLLVVESLENAGFYQYEVSNFAKKGFESRHNINYWQLGDYVGLGVGAHSHLNGTRFWNVSKLNEYLSKIKQEQPAMDKSEALNEYQRFCEALVFGLRMNEGIDIANLEKRFNVKLSKEHEWAIKNLLENKFLDGGHQKIFVTSKGRLVLDEISARLI